MGLIFMGTPQFASPSLKAIMESGEEIKAIVSQPDRPQGRGRKVELSPIKRLALEYKVLLLQPSKIRNSLVIEQIKSLNPEFIIVVAYGQRLPKEILSLPVHGCINLHASLLPRYRGAAPIQWAIINGEVKSGVTTMLMNEEMDKGGILLQEEVVIDPNDTAQSLHDKLAGRGAELLIRTLEGMRKGNLVPRPQDERLATYAPKMTKDQGRINWAKQADEVRNLVRGVTPWPGAYTYHKKVLLKVWKVELAEGKEEGQPGEVIGLSEQGILVATGKGRVVLTEVQPESGKRMNANEYRRGHLIQKGDLLGLT
ncbi:MAG: methionyl-tRNA formyltransferase [Candidatus Tectomicrobia bacterium]|nr:methionyl-tRNA formyltransferase [Candidatus Tectomicrobia bacterium]